MTIDKPQDERTIAHHAQQMAQSTFRTAVGSFKEHYRRGSTADNDPRRKPLKELRVQARIKKGNIPGTHGEAKKYYFNQLVLEMGKHGFIQNHGVSTIRESHTVQRLKPQATEYQRRHHQMHISAHEFIHQSIQISGVEDYVVQEISQIRGYEVLNSVLKRMAETVNAAQPKSKNL
ncbi:MAG: hypothetical protein Q4F57_02415 [Weeksellaceae bacterium]|nr:hypothetical protein [Weeksellaceae bacterium]